MSHREFRCFTMGSVAVLAGNATKPIPAEPPLVRSFDDFINTAGKLSTRRTEFRQPGFRSGSTPVALELAKP